jgi:hypothetical protein
MPMSNSVKIVTLVRISIPRIGAASQGAFALQKKSYEGTRVVEDSALDTIVKEVKWVASQNGEPATDLAYLEQIQSNYSSPNKKLEFQLIPPGSLVGQSTPYATCEMETALEVDGRYFKVEEVKI